MSEYGIPHPIHTIWAAERIARESIPSFAPSLELGDLGPYPNGIHPDLIKILGSEGIFTAGQLSELTDTELYNRINIDPSEFQELQYNLGKVGLAIIEENDRTILRPDDTRDE